MAALLKSAAVSLSIVAIRYAAEYARFGELRHGGREDGWITVLYFLAMAVLFARIGRLEARLSDRNRPRYVMPRKKGGKEG